MVGRWRARASHDTIATVEENDGNDDGHDGGDEGDIDGSVDDTSEFEQQLRAQGQFGRGAGEAENNEQVDRDAGRESPNSSRLSGSTDSDEEGVVVEQPLASPRYSLQVSRSNF